MIEVLIFIVSLFIGRAFREIISKILGKEIKYKRFVIEIVTAVTFTGIYLSTGLSFEFIKMIVLFAVLIISAFIDYKTKEVYFAVSLVAIIFGIVFGIVDFINGQSLIQISLSVIIPLIVIGVIMLIGRKFDGMGGGDLEVFLYTALYLNVKQIVLTLVLSILIAAAASLILSIVSKNKEKDIAFVPYIAIAAFLAVTIGTYIIQMWILIIS